MRVTGISGADGNLPRGELHGEEQPMEAEAERLAQMRTTLRQKSRRMGNAVVTDDLIQTLRILARSHRRFTEEQKTKVFRSIVKEAKVTAAGVELELYVQPTQNVGGSIGRSLQRPTRPESRLKQFGFVA
jgi:hypothetical protein